MAHALSYSASVLHAAAPPAPPLRPAPPAASSLRLGTFNVGLGFLHKLPGILTRCSQLALDVVALQEIGDPALLSTRLSPYQLVYSAGPSHSEAGVGLLLSLALSPRIRSFRRSSTGRLIGAVLELSAGHSMLLVSAYMPTGLDRSPPGSDKHELAHKLYAEMLQWSIGMQQVIVMGDLNETLTRWDRLPLPPVPGAAGVAAAVHSPIRCLPADGFVDVYRHLHPSAERQPGHTHIIDGVRPTRSRLDYIWIKGAALASLVHIAIDHSPLDSVSHHRLLWSEVQLPHPPAASCTTPLLQMRLPNLRAATKHHKVAFVSSVQHAVLSRHAEFVALARSASASMLDCLATSLTQLVRSCAASAFPVTGAETHSSNLLLKLQMQLSRAGCGALVSLLLPPLPRLCSFARPPLLVSFLLLLFLLVLAFARSLVFSVFGSVC
jgi:exonuclease III